MAKKEVSIRMYRQGLGDCFVLTFPRQSKPFHMLVDCGALNSKHYDSSDMVRIVKEIRTFTKDRLDVVAATHEHFDHTSGFVQAQGEFDRDRRRQRLGRVDREPRERGREASQEGVQEGEGGGRGGPRPDRGPARQPARALQGRHRGAARVLGGPRRRRGERRRRVAVHPSQSPERVLRSEEAPARARRRRGRARLHPGPTRGPGLREAKAFEEGDLRRRPPELRTVRGLRRRAPRGDDTQAGERALPFAKRYRIEPRHGETGEVLPGALRLRKTTTARGGGSTTTGSASRASSRFTSTAIRTTRASPSPSSSATPGRCSCFPGTRRSATGSPGKSSSGP